MSAAVYIRVGAAALLLGLVSLAVGAGGTRAFTSDQSVHITSPDPLATVPQPFTISWQGPRLPDRQYAVFVDVAPIPPGGTLRDLAPQLCRDQPSCQPSRTYLAGLGVYVTRSDHITVPSIATVAGQANHDRNRDHDATLVVLDANGRRTGSAAWQVEFRA